MLQVLASGHENFTVRFYSVVSDDNARGSFIASPVSVSSVLALASVGAKGDEDQGEF